MSYYFHQILSLLLLSLLHCSNATSHLTPGSALLLSPLEDGEGGPPPAQLEEGEGGPPSAQLEEGGGGARRFSYSDLVLEQWRPAPARHD